MRLHLLAAATALTLALAACANSGGLHPEGTPLDPGTLQAGRSLAASPCRRPHGRAPTGGPDWVTPNSTR